MPAPTAMAQRNPSWNAEAPPVAAICVDRLLPPTPASDDAAMDPRMLTDSA